MNNRNFTDVNERAPVLGLYRAHCCHSGINVNSVGSELNKGVYISAVLHSSSRQLGQLGDSLTYM